VTDRLPHDLRERLARGAWFGGLEAPLQQAILDRLVPRQWARDAVIQREGVPSAGMYYLLDGRLGLFKTTGAGHEELIHVGEPGLWFAELNVLTRQPLLTIRALAASEGLLLPTAAFDELVAAEPRYYRPFAELAFRRLALAFRYASEKNALPAETLLRARLAGLAEMRRFDLSLDGPVALALSQDELAQLTGLSRQTVNRLLKELEEAGLVELGSRTIRVLDPSRLR
jgi:CRP-like cAMP-binding protein